MEVRDDPVIMLEVVNKKGTINEKGIRKERGILSLAASKSKMALS